MLSLVFSECCFWCAFSTYIGCDIFQEMYYILECYKERVTDLDFIKNILIYYSLNFLFLILFANSVFHDKEVLAYHKNILYIWNC